MQAHDHYREAERLLEKADSAEGGSDLEHYFLSAAQVHATLALAAAQGANRPPADRLDTRTFSEPAQGDLIVDQMGDIPQAPNDEDVPFCDDGRCFRDRHDATEPHVDADGREFR